MKLCCISIINVEQHSLGVEFLFIVNVEGAIYKDEKWLLLRLSEIVETNKGEQDCQFRKSFLLILSKY